MAKISKRNLALQSKVDRDKIYQVADALALVKETATAKFDESVDAVVNLGIDARKSDQLIRGALVLPNGTGKTKRVAVFAQGAQAEAAKAAGAEIVGFDISNMRASSLLSIVNMPISYPFSFLPWVSARFSVIMPLTKEWNFRVDAAIPFVSTKL